MGRNCVFQQFHLTLPEIESSRHNTKEMIHHQSRLSEQTQISWEVSLRKQTIPVIPPTFWKNQSTQEDIEATHIWLNSHISATLPSLKLTAKAPENRPKNGPPKRKPDWKFQASIFRVWTCFSGGSRKFPDPTCYRFGGEVSCVKSLMIIDQHGHLFNKNGMVS